METIKDLSYENSFRVRFRLCQNVFLPRFYIDSGATFIKSGKSNYFLNIKKPTTKKAKKLKSSCTVSI